MSSNMTKSNYFISTCSQTRKCLSIAPLIPTPHHQNPTTPTYNGITFFLFCTRGSIQGQNHITNESVSQIHFVLKICHHLVISNTNKFNYFTSNCSLIWELSLLLCSPDHTKKITLPNAPPLPALSSHSDSATSLGENHIETSISNRMPPSPLILAFLGAPKPKISPSRPQIYHHIPGRGITEYPTITKGLTEHR